MGCGSGCPQGPQLNGAIYKPAVSLRERVHPTQSSFPNCCHCKLLASEEHTPETEKRRNFQQQARQAPPLELSAWLAGPSQSPTFPAREWKGMPPAPSPPGAHGSSASGHHHPSLTPTWTGIRACFAPGSGAGPRWGQRRPGLDEEARAAPSRTQPQPHTLTRWPTALRQTQPGRGSGCAEPHFPESHSL